MSDPMSTHDIDCNSMKVCNDCPLSQKIAWFLFRSSLIPLACIWLSYPLTGYMCDQLKGCNAKHCKKGSNSTLVLVDTLDIGCDQLPNILSYINTIVLALMQES